MQIIVDADACPKAIKEILYRAAQRLNIPLTLVANTHIRTPQSVLFKSISVPQGFDVADDRIVELVEKGDLVITADIPLAARVIEKGAVALDPRGEFYTEENVGARLSVRNFMAEMRESGLVTGGPASLNSRDKEAFARELNKFLDKHK